MEKDITTKNIPVGANKKPWYKKVKLYLITFIFLLILAFVFAFIGSNVANQNLDNTALIGDSKIPDELLYKHTEDDPTWGNNDAKIKIIEFSDFECPFCQESFPVVRELLFKYLDDVYLVYRDFPDLINHPNSGKAAEAANCAHEQGKFWPMHDKLFINQENLSLDDLRIYAMEVGLETEAFAQCLNSGKYATEIQQDYQDGVELGVIGTPTFFINGYKISGSIPRDILFNIADAILATN